MDAAAIRNCIAATLDADADARRRAELQLKQVRLFVWRPGRLVLCVWWCGGTRCAPGRRRRRHTAILSRLVDPPPGGRPTPSCRCLPPSGRQRSLTFLCQPTGRGPAWLYRRPAGSCPVGAKCQSSTPKYARLATPLSLQSPWPPLVGFAAPSVLDLFPSTLATELGIDESCSRHLSQEPRQPCVGALRLLPERDGDTRRRKGSLQRTATAHPRGLAEPGPAPARADPAAHPALRLS